MKYLFFYSYKNNMTVVDYSPFIIKPIGEFKCPNFEFDKRYLLIQLAKRLLPASWDHCHYASEGGFGRERPLMKWRVHTRGEFIKVYWPKKGNPEYVQNGFHVHIIFLKYRTIFKCLIRLMMLKKRAQMRIKTRKNLKIARLFRGVGHSNLNTQILTFV